MTETGRPVPSIDDILATPVRPRRETAEVSLRWDLVARHHELEAQLAAARRHDETTNAPNTAPAIAAQVLELEAEIRETLTTFVFQSIGTTRWKKLLAEHGPTKEQRQQGLDHNPNTFPRIAIAASCVEPTGMTSEKVDELLAREDATVGIVDELWSACLRANMSGRRPGESVAASAIVQRSRPNSESPEPTDSLEAS